MEISIATKSISGVLVVCILGFAYLSFSYFPVSQGIAYLFIGATFLMTVVLLYYINGVMNKHRKTEGYTPYNPIGGYNPKPEVPYVPQSRILQDSTIQDNSGVVVSNSSGVTNIYNIKYEKPVDEENSEKA